MKTQRNLLAVVGLVTLSMSSAAQASVSKMTGTWIGTGSEYSLQGDLQGAYLVQLVDTLQADGSVASAVTVTIPNQPDKHFNQVLRDSTNGFSMTSDQGSGGAVCVSNGLCEGYFGDANGNGTAMTIIIDGPDAFRSVKTELQNFKAVRIYGEKYVRSSK